MASLRQACNFEIKGTSGRTLLHAYVNDLGSGRRRLALASVGCKDDPRTVVTNPGHGRGLEICGKGNEVYGMLVPDPSTAGSSVLCFKDRPVMKIQKGRADFSFTASDMNGVFLGSCGGVDGSFSGEQWTLQVEPGHDAVLIVSCMLGLSLL
jgi:hypothetical protein